MIYTTQQAANHLELSRNTIQEYCRRYKIGEKWGRDYMLSGRDLDVIRERMRSNPSWIEEDEAERRG